MSFFLLPDSSHRRSIRLKRYDYTQPGAYFVTLLAWRRECLFGELVGDDVQLSEAGRVLEYYWNTLPAHFSVKIDQWVIMPNHFHGIIWLIDDPVRAKQPGKNVSSVDICISGRFALTGSAENPPHGTASGSLGAIIQNFKSNTAREINRLRQTPGHSVWQRNYYDHIIRNEDELINTRLYILDNPRQWVEDEHNIQI